MDKEQELLSQAVEDIAALASQFGLDYYPMRFEICPAEILYTFGAYGMPTRFTHWSFGKAYHRMKTSYDYNLSRIYELVINSDPCYAFLLEGNSLIQNKLVIAHVFAHCDFFKNNYRFAKTNRDMVNSMAAAASRISQYEYKYGRKRVETFLDAALALQEHIEPYPTKHRPQKDEDIADLKPVSAYDDLWNLAQQAVESAAVYQEDEEAMPPKTFPSKPEKDLLLFIMENAQDLADWEREILSITRAEMRYFWPQIETKIMNEGWASLWHARIMRALPLTEAEVLEFAKMHASVVQPSRTSLNPYYLGMKLWEDLEKRFGTEQLFEIRETENDSSFLRNYLTEELMDELDLYLYKKVGHQWQIIEKDWKKVKNALLNNLVNGGFPTIMVTDGNYQRNGELYLKHSFEGIELDIRYLEKTLPYVYKLWRRPVHLETIIDSKAVLFSFNGERSSKKIL